MINDPLLNRLTFALACLVVVGIVKLVASEVTRFRRKQEIAQLAEQLNLVFETDQLRSEELVHKRYCDFSLVANNVASTFTNLMVSRTDDVKLSLFDYGYCKRSLFDSEQDMPDIFQTVLAIETPQFELSFRLGTEGDRNAEMIKCVPPKLMNLIDANPQYCFEGIGNMMWVYEDQVLQSPTQYSKLIQLGHDVCESVVADRARRTATLS